MNDSTPHHGNREQPAASRLLLAVRREQGDRGAGARRRRGSRTGARGGAGGSARPRGECSSGALLAGLRAAAERKRAARRLFAMLDRRLRAGGTPAPQAGRRRLRSRGRGRRPGTDGGPGLYSDRHYAEAWCRDCLRGKAVGRRYLETEAAGEGHRRRGGPCRGRGRPGPGHRAGAGRPGRGRPLAPGAGPGRSAGRGRGRALPAGPRLRRGAGLPCGAPGPACRKRRTKGTTREDPGHRSAGDAGRGGRAPPGRRARGRGRRSARRRPHRPGGGGRSGGALRSPSGSSTAPPGPTWTGPSSTAQQAMAANAGATGHLAAPARRAARA